ncbi:MAG TPA: hypothetical protein VK179_19440 [Bacteroidales bacterium]|nr:hypothetical protein [Bacteroidales bacterium]
MFYQSHDEIDSNLRFGDIISGFPFISFTIDDFPETVHNFNLNFSSKKFYVVLTPCCSIEDGALILSPLEQILPKFFDNPYFKEDFTRINRITLPKYMLPEMAWSRMKPEERDEKLSREPEYPFVENYIYSEHELLPKYELKYKSTVIATTGYYMINFKRIVQINSKRLNRPVQIPKILQLTIPTREELRKKIVKYYNRVPQEDIIA